MINYQLPKFELPKLKFPKGKSFKSKKRNFSQVLISAILISSLFGFLAAMIPSIYFYRETIALLNSLNIINSNNTSFQNNYLSLVSQEKAVIEAVDKSSKSVVSIIISKEQPIYETYYPPFFEEFFDEPFFEFMIPEYRQKGVEKKQVGGGTGFIISEDGMVLTNKHVVLDEEAEYTVLTSDNKEFPAEVLARDPFQDIAVLKITQEDPETEVFPTIKLGDSDKVKIGQTAIAIGYVLGRYQNTISVGVISGLGRTITASSGDFYETLEDIIQTDAAINKGNSGGPLLNLKGEVIGINTAIDVEGQNIGFTIPINKAKRGIEQVKTIGKIVYPFLGIRYVLIDKEIKEANSLEVDQGALIIKGDKGESAIFPDSAADKSDLKEGDVVLEFNGERITLENTLAKIILKYNPGDSVSLKILTEGTERVINVILGEI